MRQTAFDAVCIYIKLRKCPHVQPDVQPFGR